MRDRPPGADDELLWRLFLDDAAIARGQGVRTTFVRPVKGGSPVIHADQGYGQNPYAFGTLLFDPDRRSFRLWYQTFNRDTVPSSGVLYAESRDAREWTMPEGTVDCPGLQAGNVVLATVGPGDLHSPSVIEDVTSADPSRRYKMIYTDYIGGKDPYVNGGACVAFSPDGTTWTRYERNPVLRFARRDDAVSDVVDVYRDPVTRQFELYAKGWTKWRPRRDGVLRPGYRIIVRSVSDDFIHWSRPEVVVDHRFDRSDPQSYGMPVFRAGDMRIGLLRSYKKPGDDTIDIRLTASRDGMHWSYPMGLETFIPIGDPGSFDAGLVFTTAATTWGDQSYLAYGGWSGPHEDKSRRAAIGMASTIRHRFVGVSGMVDTPPGASAGRLFVNADAAPNRPLFYELVDDSGTVIPGFSREDCVPIVADGARLPLTFTSEARLPRRVSIRFHAVDSIVFAYRI